MLKWILPFVVLVVGALLAAVLLKTGPEPTTQVAESILPPVEFLTVEPVDHTLVVQSEGSVAAGIESVLLPEVSGRVVALGDNFDAGRFFEEGEVLLEIDPLLYEGAVAEAEARLARARLSLAQEIAQGEQAAEEWRELGRGEPSDLTLRKPQQAMARAEIHAAEAAVKIARENLARTQVRAPFRGRLRETFVDLGQVVLANQTRLATIYTIERAEVRLPLSLAEFERLGLEGRAASSTSAPRAAVRLSAQFGTRRHTWDAYLDRVEGTIDPLTRLIHVVAVCKDPYGRAAGDAPRPALKVGLFVEAEIEGRHLEDVFVLSRQAMVRENEVYVIDEENRLHRRQVEVVSADAEMVVIREGLQAGDRVNLSPIDFFIEGMEVRPDDGREDASTSAPVDDTPEAAS